MNIILPNEPYSCTNKGTQDSNKMLALKNFQVNKVSNSQVGTPKYLKLKHQGRTWGAG